MEGRFERTLEQVKNKFLRKFERKFESPVGVCPKCGSFRIAFGCCLDCWNREWGGYDSSEGFKPSGGKETH